MSNPCPKCERAMKSEGHIFDGTRFYCEPCNLHIHCPDKDKKPSAPCPKCSRVMRLMGTGELFNGARFYCGWCGWLVHFDKAGAIIGDGHGKFYRYTGEQKK